jgi:hypothetical protein
VLAESMALGTFKPGRYTLTLKVTDKTLAKSWDMAESFRVVQ